MANDVVVQDAITGVRFSENEDADAFPFPFKNTGEDEDEVTSKNGTKSEKYDAQDGKKGLKS